jgi:hypothetical protein
MPLTDIFFFGLILLPFLVILVLPLVVYRFLRSWRQTLKWEAGLLLASAAALLGYFRLQDILGPPFPLPVYIFWTLEILAVLSPASIAVAWLRLGGMKWRLSLALFPLVPAGMVALWVVVEFPFWAS